MSKTELQHSNKYKSCKMYISDLNFDIYFRVEENERKRNGAVIHKKMLFATVALIAIQ